MGDLHFETRVNRAGGRTSTGHRAMIGQYEIIGRLGAGGMGTVHLGRALDGRIVAVKVIHPRLAVDEQFLERFRREAALASRVAAFCTAPVIDFGEDEEGPFLVTEYVDGIPLSRAVAERGPLPSSSVQGVAVGVAAALTAIHSAGLIHRDLKPGNVILSLCGPRVIDFGVARAVDGSSDLTRTGMMVGSPGWMAPEQARGGPVTQAADIFAWGCLVAFASTGRHPFGDGDSVTRVLQILHEPPDLTGVPEGLYPHVARAVSKRPEDRPNARTLLSMLSGAGADLTELVALAGYDPAPSLANQPPRQRTRRRWPMLAALITGVSVAAAAAAVTYPSLVSGTAPGTILPSPAESASTSPAPAASLHRSLPATKTAPGASPTVPASSPSTAPSAQPTQDNRPAPTRPPVPTTPPPVPPAPSPTPPPASPTQPPAPSPTPPPQTPAAQPSPA
ncbi:serine/threonine-protein kinase [Longispora albida]|uniref:serine/threonine-protein kinase n=1 Tax=Longispora albida TaxID=203523 RepID=UPI0003AA2EE6|nr:serine/threonine-protein kinase [Longispora albida]